MAEARPHTIDHMPMTLTVTEQLRILAKIWGDDRTGYVFLPVIPGTARDVKARRKGYREGPGYKWPVEKDKIRKFLTDHEDDDVYFTPCLFEEDRRIEQYAKHERALWADLDEVDPTTIQDEWTPTICWESSPGRFQGIWLLEQTYEGASWAGKENQRLTIMLGADPSGWDTTQLLRVPGRMNHKPTYEAPQPGRMIWDDGPVYPIERLAELPEVAVLPTGEDVDFIDEEAVSRVDRHDVWGRVRLKVSGRVREFMAVRGKPGDIERGEGVDRSEVAWEVCRELADAGCSITEIVALIRASVWNSYSGRNDELKRLKMQAAKAVGDRAGASSLETEFEEVIRSAPPTMYDLMRGIRTRPSWLIRNVWESGAVGFISGEPKSYKSWIGLDMAVSVATGAPFLGDLQFSIAGDGATVLYVQEEDGETTVLDRAESIIMGRDGTMHPHGWVETAETAVETLNDPGTGIGSVWWHPPVHDRLRRLHTYVRRGFRVSDPGWQSWLDETLGDIGAELLVIDTLGTTAGVVDTDKASDLNDKVLSPLRVLSAKHGCAIVVVHHNNKSADDKSRGGKRMLGSVALHAWVENALYISSKVRAGVAYEVMIERESKAAADSRFKLRIPQMGVAWTHDGVTTRAAEAGFRMDQTTWWNPQVIPVFENEDGGTNTAVASAAERAATRKGRGRPAGAKIADRLKQMGATKDRPKPLQDIADINGTTLSATRGQLQSAIESGLVDGNPERGYWLV